jgi:hypothetical protein
MANPTTNYGFIMPSSTDLVTDLPADFDVFGQAVDTTIKALNPSTTEGDIEYRSDTANTNSRLAIGTAGQVLTVNAGADAPEWAALPAAVSGLTLISATACSAVASQAISAFSSTYENYRIVIIGDGSSSEYLQLRMRDLTVDSSASYYAYTNRYASNNTTQTYANSNGAEIEVTQNLTATTSIVDIFRPFIADRTSFLATGTTFYDSGTLRSVGIVTQGVHNVATSYNGFNMILSAGTFTGTIYVYGYQKA